MLEALCVRRLIVLVSVASLIVGCASEPTPVVTSEVTPGDSAQVNAQRGHQFVPVYQFVQYGHQYAFAHAYSDGTGPDLLFIDAKLACSSQTPIDELTNWQWVGEPDGLAYLASRLRQACGLEPGTAPRTQPLRCCRSAPSSSLWLRSSWHGP